MAGHGKGTDTEGETLWQLVTQDIAPWRKKTDEAAVLPPPKPAKKVKTSTDAGFMPAPIQQGQTGPAAKDLDRRTLQKLERGQMDIEAVLDLHGHSQNQAYDALHGFIPQAHARGMRCVLVITGKGRTSGGSLRANLAEWLESPSLHALVLRVVPARQKHGGGGAFYVYLRRARG